MNRIMEILNEQDRRIQALEEENQRLNEGLQVCLEELMQVRSARQAAETEKSTLHKSPSFKWGPLNGKQVASPTRPTTADHSLDSPHPSPNLPVEHDHSKPSKPMSAPIPQQTPAERQIQPKPSQMSINGASRSREGENQFKSFKVSLDDPCWKVLPAALKKYKISDDWQQYAMFICYGSTERCLSYDEKPLLLFQRLKDANKNPVFMLRHIKDIRSPIAVAQQKQSAKQAPSSKGPASSPVTSIPTTARTTRPGALQSAASQAQRIAAVGTPPISSATITGPQWPDTSDLSHDRSRTASADDWHGDAQPTPLSQAIAIYPYQKEQDDEFDVAVDDTFVITARAKGWWVVQRDPRGTGVVDEENSEKCWVPAGCLLETNVPPRTAISDASPTPLGPDAPLSNGSILPQSIVSTSFPGIALMNYTPKGEYELELMKDDVLRVFKRYNHWSYAIKEDKGERGWVPSWFIGKVAGSGSSSVMPPTPVPGSSMHGNTSITSEHDPSDMQERILLPMNHPNGAGSPLASPALPT
jgi:bZIP factor